MTNQPTSTSSRPMSLLEVAILLRAPASAVCATLVDRPGAPAPLLAAGFPRPMDLLHGRPRWHREEVEAFAADQKRLNGAVEAAWKGAIGQRFFVGGGGTFELRGEG